MLSIFLLNDNKIVSRLLQLSSDKNHYLLEEKTSLEPSQKHYDFILVDSDKYSPALLKNLKMEITYKRLGYIGVKNEPVPEGFDIHLDKPFLPSDFVSLIEQNSSSTEESTQSHQDLNLPEETFEASNSITEEDLELEELTLDEELETLEPMEPVQSNIDDLLQENDENIDLDLEEELEALETVDDLELLPQDHEKPVTTEVEEKIPEDIDLSLDASQVMSTGVAEQYLQTDEEENTPHDDLNNILDEIESIDSQKEITLEETSPEADTSIQNSTDDETDTATKTAVGAAAIAAATTLVSEPVANKENPEEESDLNSLDTLESVEDVEHESDYLSENITTEELAGEFDTLNEEEVRKALEVETKPTEENEEKEIAEEEIISEEITPGGEETLVESNDVEKWIAEAVSKAITPEMIKEALNDMKINITLDFSKKDA